MRIVFIYRLLDFVDFHLKVKDASKTKCMHGLHKFAYCSRT